MMRLSITPEMFKKLKKKKPKKIKINDENEEKASERNEAREEPGPILTPLLSPQKKDVIQESDMEERAQSLEESEEQG